MDIRPLECRAHRPVVAENLVFMLIARARNTTGRPMSKDFHRSNAGISIMRSDSDRSPPHNGPVTWLFQSKTTCCLFNVFAVSLAP
jgi:hypothetical protein